MNVTEIRLVYKLLVLENVRGKNVFIDRCFIQVIDFIKNEKYGRNMRCLKYFTLNDPYYYYR